MEVKVINKSKHRLPEYQTPGSAGMDLKADIDEPIVIKPFERVLISTGIYIALPIGYEAQLRPRSGLACKYGITLATSPATIDSDYRGAVKVCLINLSHNNFVVNPGERIAQMIVARYANVEWVEVTQLDATERGDGGFGHTGV